MRDVTRFSCSGIAVVLVLGTGVCGSFMASASFAQAISPAGSSESSAIGQAEAPTPSGQTTGQVPADKRYALVKSGEDILRIDREAGSVSFCSKSNQIWRCVPAPLAEEAYQAEIASLADEVDGLNARIKELEAERSGGNVLDDQGAQGAEPQTKKSNPASPDEGISAKPVEPGVSEKSEDGPTKLSNEDEKQLDEMLQFSEKAMRRFFGLMKDLKGEFERPTK
ncbi:hypothetical protein [Roseibium algae]|uniref:Secreted protein n=1 Tax=Roseibium algae TaxID=3123038 RepID=A0ABU8TGR3_9HYPH